MTGHARAARGGRATPGKAARVLLWALCLGAGAAQGATSNTLVAHPLVVVGGTDADAQRLAALLDAELVLRDVKLAPAGCAGAFLRGRGTPSCGGSEDCLAQLAQACGAARALSITVYPNRPKVLFTAKVVSADGRVEKVVTSFEVARPKGKPTAEVVRTGLQQLLTVGIQLEALDLAPLVPDVPAAPQVAPPAAPLVPPPVLPAPPPPAPEPGTSGQRIAAYAVGGAGVVLLGLGTVFYFVAKGNESSYQSTLDPYGQRPNTPQAASQQASLRSDGPLVTWTLIGGAALVVTGVILFVTEPKPSSGPSARVSLLASEGGGALVVNGKF
jgi:hypothetical protein